MCLIAWVYICVGLFVCLWVCNPPLCGRVTDRMRPLSRRCWGDNQYCSPRCVATVLLLYAWWGRQLQTLAEEEPGEYGHVHAQANTPNTGLCCHFYDTWQDNDSVAPLKLYPMDVFSPYAFWWRTATEFCLKIHYEQWHLMSIQWHLYFGCECVQNQEKLFVDMMYLYRETNRKKWTKNYTYSIPWHWKKIPLSKQCGPYYLQITRIPKVLLD